MIFRNRELMLEDKTVIFKNSETHVRSSDFTSALGKAIMFLGNHLVLFLKFRKYKNELHSYSEIFT